MIPHTPQGTGDLAMKPAFRKLAAHKGSHTMLIKAVLLGGEKRVSIVISPVYCVVLNHDSLPNGYIGAVGKLWPAGGVCKPSFTGPQPRPFTYALSMATFPLQRQHGVVVMEMDQPTEPNMFTICLLQPKFADFCYTVTFKCSLGHSFLLNPLSLPCGE